jgi:hypothetical protein
MPPVPMARTSTRSAGPAEVGAQEMTQAVATPRRPAPPAKNTLPAGVTLSRFWKETPDGLPVKHDHERPVVDETDMPVGVWWMCPEETCAVGEWVFPRGDGEPARPKKQGCPDHVLRLLPGLAESTDGDPKQAARNWLTRTMAERAAAARRSAVDAANARIDTLRAAGRQEAAKLRSDLREHVPSAAVSLAALAGDWVALEKLGTLETYAVGASVAVGGMVLAYWAVYVGELVWARRMGYTLRELPRSVRARAMSHARWIAAGVLCTGVWLLAAQSVGARLDNVRGLLMNMFAAVLIAVVNYNPWAAMVKRRRAAARAARAAAEAAARAEEERLAAEAAERRRRAAEAEAARRAAEEAARRLINADDDRITAGRKFAERWRRIAEDARGSSAAGVGFEIWRTGVVVDATRRLTARDADGEAVIGWEFLIRGEPGVLTPRGGADVSPLVAARRWIASMLETDPAMVEVAYEPESDPDENGDTRRLFNHGLITLSETFPLSENVDHPGAGGVRKDKSGWWAFAGRDLRGRNVYRRHWTPGQAGGAGRYGVTGTGKSVVTQITALGDLHLGIFPIIHDAGKNGMDFTDFYGIFPVGHTIEHRDVIRESLWAEMKRRQRWTNMRTTRGLGGMEVTANPTWDPAVGGPPIRCTWEEFHMHMKDQKFVTMLGEMIRLQRATAIMAELATQGTGLRDTGDNNLREQVNQICTQLMRMTDHTARLAGYTGGFKASDLPRIAGMMIMVDGDNEPIPYRSAFVDRNPNDPRSLIYRMRQPDGTAEGRQILFAPDLPDETIEVFREHGLMDLWEMGKTRSGREALQSAADPVESISYPDALAALLGTAGTTAAPVKPRMRADEVVLAILKHQTEQGQPYMLEKDLLASPWWRQVHGEWSKGSGVPAASTIGRACERLATQPEPLVVRDADKQWSLTPTGVAHGDQALTTLRATGVLGSQAKAQAQAAGVDVGAMERRAELEAEQYRLINDLVREARAATVQE